MNGFSENEGDGGAARMPRRLCGAILVGGASRRMGRPKASLPFQGRALIDHISDIVSPFVETLAWVGSTPAPPEFLQPHFSGRVRWLQDVVPGAGPIAGILAALESDPRADWLCTACDMPSLSAASISFMIGQSRRVNADVTAVRLAEGAEVEPLPAIYTPNAADALRTALSAGQGSLRAALRGVRLNSVPAPAELRAEWNNVNTPEEWVAAQSVIDKGRGR